MKKNTTMATQMTKAQAYNFDKRHTNAVDTTVHSPFHASIDRVQKSEELIQPKNRLWDPNFNNTYFNEAESGIFRRHINYILYKYGTN